MAYWIWILIAIAIVVIIAIALSVHQQRSAALRRRFGPEYDRAIEANDGRRAGEARLRGRQKERAKLEITPLPGPARERFAAQWRELQEHFVDQPSAVVMQADALVQQVMSAEGYPVKDFDSQADLVSVDHPRVMADYRAAHEVSQRAKVQTASTEDLRTALLSYRSLFDELLVPAGGGGRADGAHVGTEAAPRGAHAYPEAPSSQPYDGTSQR